MQKNAVFAGILLTLLGMVSISSHPILDEGSYLWIAKRFSFVKPYDWPLPFPPFDDAFVFAHPPLLLMWIAILQKLGLSGWFLKMAAGIPLWFLLGYASYRLCLLYSSEPKKSFAMWFSLPIVMMACSRTAMPDLMMCSFATTSMWFYAEGQKEEGSEQQVTKNFFCSAMFLGLASWCKYPALLLFFPLFMTIKNPTKHVLPILIGFLGIWGLGEIFLYLSYGKFHLLEVVIRAIEIPRGPLHNRFVGFALRLLVGAPLLFFGIKRLRWNTGALTVSLFCVLICSWSMWGMSSIQTLLMGFLCLGFFGYHLGILIFDSQKRSTTERKLLQVWVVVVWIGIVATHNYAAPRYWILAMLPMVLLIPPSQIKTSWITLCALWSVSLLWAEHQFANQGFLAAQHVLEEQEKKNNTTPQYFTGEWTFRWTLQEKGWIFAPEMEHQSQQFKEQKICAQPKHSIATECFRYTNQTWSGVSFPLILMDVDNQISYYSETAGFWPIGFSFDQNRPLEEIRY